MGSDGERCDFGRVRHGTGESNACTPAVADGFEGVAIRAPAQVGFGPSTRVHDPFANSAFPTDSGAFTRLMVAGLRRGRGRWLDGPVTLTATDVRTRRSFVAVDHRGDGAVVLPGSKLTGSVRTPDGERFTVTTYFNVNLALVLPAVEATYEIDAVAGPHRSNKVTVRVVREGPGR